MELRILQGPCPRCGQHHDDVRTLAAYNEPRVPSTPAFHPEQVIDAREAMERVCPSPPLPTAQQVRDTRRDAINRELARRK